MSTKSINRSAKTGKFVTKKFAAVHKATTVSEKVKEMKAIRTDPFKWVEHMRKDRKHAIKVYVGEAGYKATMIVSQPKYGFELHTGLSSNSLAEAISRLQANFSMHNLHGILTKRISPKRKSSSKK